MQLPSPRKQSKKTQRLPRSGDAMPPALTAVLSTGRPILTASTLATAQSYTPSIKTDENALILDDKILQS